MSLDVSVTGQMGLYLVTPESDKGALWMAKQIQKDRSRSHTWQSGALVVEGSDRCRDLVAGMDRDGLAVEVNGINMSGFGRSS